MSIYYINEKGDKIRSDGKSVFVEIKGIRLKILEYLHDRNMLVDEYNLNFETARDLEVTRNDLMFFEFIKFVESTVAPTELSENKLQMVRFYKLTDRGRAWLSGRYDKSGVNVK